MTLTASHYETLGVRPDADVATIRRAYHDLARQLHPDRLIDAAPERRERAAGEMRALNEAWRVLSDPARRRLYDRTLFGRELPAAAEAVMDGPVHAIRGLPWVLLIGVLVFIFVITAYAGRPTQSSAECIVVAAGSTATRVPCDRSGARHVVAHVKADSPCPATTERFQAAEDPDALCLSVP